MKNVISKNELSNYINIVNKYSNIEYLLSKILFSAAPTLTGEKVSSLITFSNDNRNTYNLWNKHKQQIKDMLNIKFLKRFGYSKEMSLKECLVILSNRFENMCPHEIGIFLGYPVDNISFNSAC